MKKLVSLAAILGIIMIAVAGMDSLDEETALFREGASTEEVLAAREFGEPAKSPPLWLGAVGIVLVIPWIVAKARKS